MLTTLLKFKQFDYGAVVTPIANGIKEEKKRSKKLKKKADKFLKLVQKYEGEKKNKAIQSVIKAREQLKLLAIELMKQEEEEFAMFLFMFLAKDETNE